MSTNMNEENQKKLSSLMAKNVARKAVQNCKNQLTLGAGATVPSSRNSATATVPVTAKHQKVDSFSLQLFLS